ncbi:DUF4240 domain-containing protein [Actinoplanes sp. CA-054009]
MIGEEVFWQLLEAPGPDFGRAVDRLAQRSEDDITGFADRLATLLAALDTPGHLAAAHTASDDVFLYVRCAVVAAGRGTYEKVLRTPDRLADFADDEAELLLTVAPRGYEQATGMLWEHDDDPDGPAEPWLTLIFGDAVPGGVPGAYSHFLDAIVAMVVADPAWRRWWAPAGVPSCELWLTLAEPPEVAVKKGRRRLQVRLTRMPASFPADDPPALLALAVDELRGLLGVARDHLGLGPLPPLPAPEAGDLPPEAFERGPGDELLILPPELEERAMRGEPIGIDDIIDCVRAHPDAENADFWRQLIAGQDGAGAGSSV